MEDFIIKLPYDYNIYSNIELDEYENDAMSFLIKTKTEMVIEFIGCMRNEFWNDKEKRNVYEVTLKRDGFKPYFFKFWDSIYNTKTSNSTPQDLSKKLYSMNFDDLFYREKIICQNKLKEMKKKSRPTAYSILSCLTTYDVGSFKDFCSEFDYDTDSISAYKTYENVRDEYYSLCKIFNKIKLN